MQPDEGPGHFVTIRPDGLTYIVGIEPVMPCGAGQPRTYGSQHEAFSAVRALWTDHRLPCRDMTICRNEPSKPRRITERFLFALKCWWSLNDPLLRRSSNV